MGTIDPNDVSMHDNNLTITDNTMIANNVITTNNVVTTNNVITVNDDVINNHKIVFNLRDMQSNGFVFKYGEDSETNLSTEQLTSLLELHNWEIKLREENPVVKDAWQKYCMALKLVHNDDSDK